MVWEPDKDGPNLPRCLNVDQKTNQGRYTNVLVPSILAIKEDEIWIGEGAKRLRAEPGAGTEEYKSWFAETKNDMGVRRTYHKAPVEFRSARAIAAEILKFLNDAALEESNIPVARTVVTVPASFQTAQRHDTVSAAQRAGITLGDGELLDEPIAAFLGYLAEYAQDEDDILPQVGASKNLLVFDFGGGTCDVAIFRLSASHDEGFAFTPISVSRYHRLGGGDIDRAIIHEVLIPQLVEQNELDRFSLGFEEKRQRIQPALLAIAEALKQKLSIEIARQKKFGRWDETQKAKLVQIQPGSYPVELKDRTLTLKSPKLSATEFETVLAPYLDNDLLIPREDEYRISCSIFAPIQDALDRGRINQQDIDLCLVAGGSSLLPPVPEALGEYFSCARILTFPTRDDAQTAVAKGAAIQALALAAAGRAMFDAVCHDDIFFQTKAGPVVLVNRETKLPYPASNRCEEVKGLSAPQSIKDGSVGEMRIQILAGNEKRLLLEEVWSVEGPVKKGTPILLDLNFSENQILALRLRIEGRDKAFESKVENPLTHVVNPNAIRTKIEDLEEALRCGKITAEEMPDSFEKLADLYRSVRQYEKALAYYARAVQLLPSPSTMVMNRMAFCARDLNDRERAERLFAEAERIDSWSGTLFNWALTKEQWKDPAGAIGLIQKAIEMEDDPAYMVLLARLVQKTGDSEKAIRIAEQALENFLEPSSLDDFELCWFKVAARMTGNAGLIKEADAAVRRPRNGRTRTASKLADFPDMERTAEGID
jgi:molecular chaperone DnaK (HSP70)/tetratricopeptide (TPR) repeat protein